MKIKKLNASNRLPGWLYLKLKTKTMTTEQLQLIIRRMATNLYTRNSTEKILPDGKEKDGMIAEIDEDFQADLRELNRLCPEPSLKLVLHDHVGSGPVILHDDLRNLSQTGEQC